MTENRLRQKQPIPGDFQNFSEGTKGFLPEADFHGHEL